MAKTTEFREVPQVPLRARWRCACVALVLALAVGACGGTVETGGQAGGRQVSPSSTTTVTPSTTTQPVAPSTEVAPFPVEPFIAGVSPGTADAVRLRAFGHSFDRTQITLKAGEPTEVFFENADAGELHNIVISSEKPSRVVFWGETVTGITTGIYRVPALPPGTYTFLCDVHPVFMVGIIKVL